MHRTILVAPTTGFVIAVMAIKKFVVGSNGVIQ
jgi:hypothetical protein